MKPLAYIIDKLLILVLFLWLIAGLLEINQDRKIRDQLIRDGFVRHKDSSSVWIKPSFCPNCPHCAKDKN